MIFWILAIVFGYFIGGFITLTVLIAFDKDMQNFNPSNSKDVEEILPIVFLWPLAALLLLGVGAVHAANALAKWLRTNAS